ncbi:MAG: putative lipid II flippase FtsW [Verrucomicrobia bacterium]|nr:putative lipid II flippase FtsW [Verrucomicrobiota bacterium]MDE3047155.1 cell division protein FtsW [Verrucomicrobiota bacterium]
MARAAILLIITAQLLFSIGLLMIFNTTAAEIIDRSLETSTHTALLKQIGYGLVGIAAGLVVYRLGYEKLIRYSYPLLICACLLLVLVFVPGIGMKINGAHRWLGIAGIPIGQPSEGVKVLLPAAFIYWLSKQNQPVAWKPFLKMLALFSLPIALILFEPDNGTASIICTLLIVLFFLARIRLLYWALPLLCLLLLGVGAASQMPHVRSRLAVYLHPELDLRGKGHQPHQAKIAAGSGKLVGRGLGESLQKLNYLPEARSDYIAAIYAEETGFVGILLLIALYMGMASAGLLIALSAQRKDAFLLAAIVTFLIAIQAFLNLGIVSGLLPSKGMTLPFFSQGGSSLMVNVVCLFILLDISRKEVNSCARY